jgi:thioredoxin 1
MIDSLTRSTIEPFVDAPGVAFLNWRDPRNAVSLLFDTAYEEASGANPDVRFGSIDASPASGDQPLAREWSVEGTPRLMVYRDGILVFSRPGLLPPPVLDGLAQAVWALDMDEVRQGLDGQGRRVFLWLRGDEGSPFQPDADADAGNSRRGPGGGGAGGATHGGSSSRS